MSSGWRRGGAAPRSMGRRSSLGGRGGGSLPGAVPRPPWLSLAAGALAALAGCVKRSDCTEGAGDAGGAAKGLLRSGGGPLGGREPPGPREPPLGWVSRPHREGCLRRLSQPPVWVWWACRRSASQSMRASSISATYGPRPRCSPRRENPIKISSSASSSAARAMKALRCSVRWGTRTRERRGGMVGQRAGGGPPAPGPPGPPAGMATRVPSIVRQVPGRVLPSGMVSVTEAPSVLPLQAA